MLRTIIYSLGLLYTISGTGGLIYSYYKKSDETKELIKDSIKLLVVGIFLLIVSLLLNKYK